MFIAASTETPRQFRPFCKDCGWRKGGVDSWDGKACKCGHAELPIVTADNGSDVDGRTKPVNSPTSNQPTFHPEQTTR